MTASTPERNAESTLRRGGTLGPPRSLPYHVLAVSCPDCGLLRTTPDELLRRDTGKLPGCPVCRVTRVTRAYRARIMRDAEFRRRERQRVDRRRGQVNARTVEAAHRSRHEWTGPELEIAARQDLTARQVADMMGRSMWAVKHVRRRIDHNPRDARLADMDTDVARVARP